MTKFPPQLLILSFLLASPVLAHAQTAENVLVAVNVNSPASVEIGEYYAEVRGVPDTQIVRLDTSVSDEISFSMYAQRIERPIADWIHRVAARQLLQQATEQEPSLIGAHLTLGEMYQETDEDDLAIERYRQTLVFAPDHVVALNNLAYLLMHQQENLEEAFRLAQRAFTLSNGTPTVADTLGWIHHLLGNDREAARYLAAAVDGLPTSAEVRLHAATVHQRLGQLDAAAQELARATELDPSLNESVEVIELRSKIQETGRTTP